MVASTLVAAVLVGEVLVGEVVFRPAGEVRWDYEWSRESTAGEMLIEGRKWAGVVVSTFEKIDLGTQERRVYTPLTRYSRTAGGWVLDTESASGQPSRIVAALYRDGLNMPEVQELRRGSWEPQLIWAEWETVHLPKDLEMKAGSKSSERVVTQEGRIGLVRNTPRISGVATTEVLSVDPVAKVARVRRTMKTGYEEQIAGTVSLEESMTWVLDMGTGTLREWSGRRTQTESGFLGVFVTRTSVDGKVKR